MHPKKMLFSTQNITCEVAYIWLLSNRLRLNNDSAGSHIKEEEVASSPVFQQKPRNVTEKLYETVYFPCQAIGFPTPTIKWVKYSSGNQETAIETSGRFVINQDGYLYILGVEWSDSGRYACIAENTHGRIIAYAHLNVVTESAPSWHVKPHNVTLYKGQIYYTLPCKTYGYPEPSYTWLKDNYPIRPWDVDLAPRGKELIFLVARTWDSGKYTCTASNIKGSISESVYVSVVPDPSIIIQPENVSTYHGEAITLSCGVVSSNEQLSVSWTRYGKNVSDHDQLISFTQQTWNNQRIYSLKISKVRNRHLGKYHCIVTNSKGTVTSSKAFISYTNSVVPLQIEVPKSEVITTEGADIELMCVFVGSPSPQITWYKDRQKLANNDSQVTVTLNNKCEAFLKLKSVTLLDAGKYGCEGGNLAGNVRGNITLFVKGKNVKAVNPFQEAKRDSFVKLQCIIMTPVLPDVAWYKDGEQLDSAKTTVKQQSNGIYSAELEIKSAQYSDTGFYTCMVQSLFGINSGNVTLKVKGSPEAPTNVTVKPQPLQTIQVTWVPGYDGGAHTIFTVQFKRSDSNSWTSTDAVNSNVTSTVLSNSEGWDGLFVFRVTAVNQFGSTESSEVSVVLRGKTDNPQQRTDQASPTSAIVGGVIGGLLLIVLIIVIVLFLRRMKKKRKTPSRPSPAVMYTVVNSENNKRNGMYDEATGIPRGRQDTYSHVSIRPDATSAMATGVGGEYASIPRSKQWEVPKRNVRLDKALGSGHFGKVMKGFLKTRQGTQIVAVKMLKDNADQQQKKEFLDELELMKTMAPHPNIVGLVGCCTKSAQPFIIVEFCSMGNLRDFLRSSHGKVVYANMAGNSLTLTCRDLLSFAWQCARGMGYLASQKVVHRDLAARNILVDKGHVCKIADFGLARDIYEKKQYLKVGEADLPLRWMAIESIFQGVTTTESDVWSFGILLWEIVTLGAHPYPALGRDQLIEELRSGYRMPKPQFCSDELYAIMWQCWQQDPASRPTFLELGKTLHRLMTAQTLSIDLDNYDRSYINATKELEL